MTSAAGEGEHGRKILQLRACPRCGLSEEAKRPIRRCTQCDFDLGLATPQLPAWPWRWWHANIVQTIASVLFALNLAFGVIRLAMLADPTASFAGALLFALPVIDRARSRRKLARGAAPEWICICPSGLVTGRGNFVVSASPWSTFKSFSMEPLGPNYRRLRFDRREHGDVPGGNTDVKLLLSDERAEALEREIGGLLESS